MSTEFKIGAKVQLKSGGPLMAIALIEKLQSGIFAHCRWFNENHVQSDIFPLKALDLVDESPSIQMQTESEHLNVSLSS